MKIRFTLIIVVLVSCYLPGFGQFVIKEADKQFDLFNYTYAAELYQKAYKQKNTLHAAERLAHIYKYNSNFKQTETWFAIAANTPGSPAENTLYYAEALKNNSKYQEASNQYLRYFALKKDVPEKQKQRLLASCDSAQNWIKNPKKATIQNVVQLNSEASDWAAVPYNNGLIFTSDRVLGNEKNKSKKRGFLRFEKGIRPDKDIYNWTGNPYLKLFFGKNGSVTSFNLEGKGYHIGPVTFTADGKEAFFAATRLSNAIYKNVKADSVATVNVELFSSHKISDTSWSEPKPFRYNNVRDYSVGDPHLSKDGKTLWFSSNMPGGKGGMDIYKSSRTDDGKWDIAVNLYEINTEGNERTPFIDSLGNFYFSSDAYVGMGGLDIYKASKTDNGSLKIENLGYPFNSPQDDFAFLLTDEYNGYLSSNRTGGKGSDDIYEFKIQPEPKVIYLSGVVYSKQSGLPLANAVVALSGGLKIETAADGTYKTEIKPDANYLVKASKRGYFAADTSFVTQASLKKNFYLEEIVLNKAIRIENIYYDFDKWNIRPDAAIELDKIVKVLTENPTISIELGSHTDSRGKDAYNLTLSQKRAESAVQYIISKGIDKDRITAKGYGETQLLNRCANNVPCSEAEHQLNRRTEFKIVKF